MAGDTPLTLNAAALDFLLARRSRPPRMLGEEIPDDDTLRTLMTAALRVPDHGKLEPWRLIVLRRVACQRLARLTHSRGDALNMSPDRIAKDASGFGNMHLIVAVVFDPKPSGNVPEHEQRASASAVCLSLLNATLAAGWGAAWLTGWQAADREFLTHGLQLFPHETVAGFIHIGNETRVPPDRPRPDIDEMTTWVDK